ncbi:hypothetical protein SETIT_4G050400v2 [Setaria italica]|uniref:KIB1-4 beta-propeller domain-containing protein n=1 Tax=Setaria italica TaxID=4555 RepID=A0A368QQW9_SETIT|nr:hypothetical protein SETIT_4G050400v2 [Setaria italica]
MACIGWSSLPAELLKKDAGRLSSDANHLHIHQVCTHWRASTSPLTAFCPWVLAGSEWWCKFVPIWDYSLRLPRRGARRLDRSPTRLVLWEPLSNTEIFLLCLSFLSRTPVGPMYEYGTYEIGAMTFFHGGKAYYIDCEKNIIICDLDTAATDDDDDLPPKCTRIFHVQSVVNRLCKCDKLHPVHSVHLVACDGDLLLVVLRTRSHGHPSWAEVYKPEWASEPYQRVELRERVMDLGDYSLFLGKRGHTFALSAKEFPAIKRNCIYYADKPYYQKRYWTSLFHLESDVLEDIPYPEELKQGEADWTPYAWFCPRVPFLKQQSLKLLSFASSAFNLY